MGNNNDLGAIQLYRKDKKYPVGIGYSARANAPKSILIHTTNGKRGSLFDSEASFLCNNNITKQKNETTGREEWVYDDDAVSANYLIGKYGTIAEIVPPEFAAWHAGKCFNPVFENANSIGIEVHYTPGEGAWTEKMWVALTTLVRYLMDLYNIPERYIEMHRVAAKPVGRKIDPSGITDAEFYTWRDHLKMIPSKFAVLGEYSKDSPLIAIAPPIDPTWAVNFIFRNGNTPNYTRYDVQQIVNMYAQTASRVGLDWWLVFCQMCHETGKLTSWWSARPRRNPAGIGVTGAWSAVKPASGAWEYKEDEKIWKAGYAFISWKVSIEAHCAHLLCYALTDEAMTVEQREFSYKSPRRNFIPASYRGAAPTVEGLTQRWAVSKVLPPEGKRYHNRIVALANSL